MHHREYLARVIGWRGWCVTIKYQQDTQTATFGAVSRKAPAVSLRRSLIALVTALVLGLMAACSVPQAPVPRSPSRPYAPAPSPTPSPRGTSPALMTPALIAGGPMGTLTAIAALFPTATPEPPYEIVNRGRPHFIEFHAWW